MRSLAKRVEARFQGAAEFRNALSRALAGGNAPTVVAPSPSPQQTRIIGAPVAAPQIHGGAPNETRIARRSLNQCAG